MAVKPDIGIIGAGRVALSLIEALKSGYNIAWVVARSAEAREKLAGYEINIIETIDEIPAPAEINILAVDDTAIESVAEELSLKFGEKLKNRFVLHLSGSLPGSLLDTCSKSGALTMKAHPYQTFYYPSGLLLKGIAWGVETDINPAPVLEMIEFTGGAPFILDKNVRELYHLSAVIASNYLTALTALAKRAAAKAGIDPDAFLRPIMQTTLNNNFPGSDAFPLTGPIARGDIETIRKHIKALKEFPLILKGYCRLGMTTVELALENGDLDKADAEKISSLLKGGAG